ncbi:hypothetical protein ACOSHH_000917 [Klebsiella aerogenes]
MIPPLSVKKSTNISIYVYLFFIGITGLLLRIFTLRGETMHFSEVSMYDAVAGDVIEHSIYTSYKIFIAVLCSFAAALIWLLAIRKKNCKWVHNPVIPIMIFFITSLLFMLLPNVIPGGETTCYRYYVSDRYYLSIVWAKIDPDRKFEVKSRYDTYIEYKDPYGYQRIDNIKNAYHCERNRDTIFLTLYISQQWSPQNNPDTLENHCTKIIDTSSLSESTIQDAYWFPFVKK